MKSKVVDEEVVEEDMNDIEEEEIDEIDDIEDDIDADIDDNDNEDEKEDSKNDADDVDDDDDDDDDGDEDDEEKQQKRRNYLKKRKHMYHPIHESTEIKVIAPENRITSEYMTIFEYSMIVGTRATHIAEGSVLYTEPQGLSDPREIAKKEIAENKCPLSITRYVSPTMMEVWEVNEMIKPLV